MMEVHWRNVPDQVNRVVSTLKGNGYEAYIVGGAVRDLLMGIEPHDYDVTTSAVPTEITKVFARERVIPTGVKHGTVTVVIDKMPIEVTTYRTEVGYDDFRHPSHVNFTRNLAEDLCRRDFTINSMAYSPNDGLIDIYEGKADISNKLIRTVGNPEKRFNEDGLRILRCIRFASQLGFRIEESTEEAMLKCKYLLKHISMERICDELIKILCGQDACRVLERYWQIIAIVIPEIEAMVDFDQCNFHHLYNIYKHSIVAVQNTPPVDYIRMAAYFHDIGKPNTFKLDENGVGHFYSHANVGTEITKNILENLKLDKERTQKILTLIKYHDMVIEPRPKVVKGLLNKLGEPLFRDLLIVKRADNFAQNPKYLYRQKQYDEIEELLNQIIEEEQCFSLKSIAINGIDVLHLGLKGKEIGDALRLCLEQVIEGKLPNEKEKLLEYIRSRRNKNEK